MAAIGAECDCIPFKELACLVKPESTYSDDAIPVGASDAVLLTGQPVARLLGSHITRDIAKPTWGNDPSRWAGKFVQLEGESELVGGGAAGDAPGIATLLRICGLAETITASTSVEYDPASTSIPSASIYFYHGRDLWQMLGCRANARLMFNEGQYPKIRWTIIGLFQQPSNAALPTVTEPTDAHPLIVNYTNTPTSSYFAGVDTGGGAFDGEFDITSLELDLGNVLEQSDRPGCLSVQITDRIPNLSIAGCAPTLDVISFYKAAEDGTTGALQLVHGVNAGEIVQLDVAKQEIDATSISATQIGNNQKGVSMNTKPLPTSGDDDFKLTIK